MKNLDKTKILQANIFTDENFPYTLKLHDFVFNVFEYYWRFCFYMQTHQQKKFIPNGHTSSISWCDWRCTCMINCSSASYIYLILLPYSFSQWCVIRAPSLPHHSSQGRLHQSMELHLGHRVVCPGRTYEAGDWLVPTGKLH